MLPLVASACSRNGVPQALTGALLPVAATARDTASALRVRQVKRDVKTGNAIRRMISSM